jgi:hypothetical protein
MTTTIPAPGTPAAVRGTTPSVERVVDHEVQLVKIDFASPEHAADILEVLRDNEPLRDAVFASIKSDNGFLLAHAAHLLTRALSKAGATDWTLNPQDAGDLAAELDEASQELDECAWPGCVWLAEDGAHCKLHGEAVAP